MGEMEGKCRVEPAYRYGAKLMLACTCGGATVPMQLNVMLEFYVMLGGYPL